MMKRISFVMCTLLIFCTHAFATIALDGNNNAGVTSAGTISATLTTTIANDVIVVAVSIDSGGVTVSSVTSSGLTFVKRSSIAYVTGLGGDVEIWYAISSSILSAKSITVNFSGTADAAAISVFGVSGANTANPFDPNSSLPSTASGSTSIPSVSSVSTSNPNVFVYSVTGAERSGSTVETAGSGFTLINTLFQNGASHSTTIGTQYKVSATSQSVATTAFGTSMPAGWGIISDAIFAPPPLNLVPAPLTTF